MITLTRSQVRVVRRVFRQALGITTRNRDLAVTFVADDNGLAIRAATHQVAIEHRLADSFGPSTLHFPFHALAECEGPSGEPVTLRPSGKQIIVEWTEGPIPQLRRFDQAKANDFPPLPALRPIDREFLAALQHAAEVTEPESTRYALGCLRLRASEGQVAATDGRQIFAQRGFDFPWQGELLVPACKALSCPKIAQSHAVEIGQGDEWLSIRCGDWSVHLRVDAEGRFPPIEDYLKPSPAGTTLHLHEADAEFCRKAVNKLPCDDDPEMPLTVDLNGTVALRSKSEQQPSATELVPANSRCTGQPLVFVTNRRYLARAVSLGFRELQLQDPNSPARCQDERRTYVWALLDSAGIVKPGRGMTRIASPAIAGEPQPTPPVVSHTSMPRTKNHTNGQPAAAQSPPATESVSPAPAEEPAVPLPELAEALKGTLENAQSQLRDLIAGLKRQRRQNKLVASTLQSLRELEELAV